MSLLTINPIPTRLSHVTLVLGLILPLACRNRVKGAEEKGRKKHKNLEEERENMRQGIHDRVSFLGPGKRLASSRNQ